MKNDIEVQYFDTEYDDIFNKWFEIEGVKKIKELSRQLRTFFNYKKGVIIYRFGSNLNLNENSINTKLFDQKRKIQSLTDEFIKIVKNLRKPSQTIEQGILSLFFESNKTKIIRFSEITEELFVLIHSFSEENISNYPRFVKFITLLAQNLFLVKRCFNAQFREFYEELETNYKNLERELEFLLENQSAKKIQPKTKLEERLTL